jgi:hypothetical protein
VIAAKCDEVKTATLLIADKPLWHSSILHSQVSKSRPGPPNLSGRFGCGPPAGGDVSYPLPMRSMALFGMLAGTRISGRCPRRAAREITT